MFVYIKFARKMEKCIKRLMGCEGLSEHGSFGSLFV